MSRAVRNARESTRIDGSAMTNKDETCICWNEADGKLHVIFAVALSGGDETILDGIVAGY